MKRGVLKWFYIAVQFIMLLVSIPKVGALFHAYDSEAFGPLFLGLDLRSWLVGIAIDATAALTSWAAMTKYEATRHSRDLLAPAIIILFCTSISIIANYEDAAVHAPAQFAHVSLFAVSVLLINPILVSSPPAIVFLLIVLVPSVMAEPRIKSAQELALEADSAAARIAAEARIKMARAQANAQVRSAQVRGLRSTVSALSGAEESAQDGADTGAGDGEDNGENEPPDDRGPDRGPGGGMRARSSADGGAGSVRNLSLITSGELRAVRRSSSNETPLHKRVKAAGVITVNDLMEACQIGDSHARSILLDVPTVVRGGTHRNARIEAPVADVLQHLFSHKSRTMKAHGERLDAALHPRKSARSNPRSDARFSAGRAHAPMRGPVRGATLGSAVAASAVASADSSAPDHAQERGQLVRFPAPADAQFSGGNIRA